VCVFLWDVSRAVCGKKKWGLAHAIPYSFACSHLNKKIGYVPSQRDNKSPSDPAIRRPSVEVASDTCMYKYIGTFRNHSCDLHRRKLYNKMCRFNTLSQTKTYWTKQYKLFHNSARTRGQRRLRKIQTRRLSQKCGWSNSCGKASGGLVIFASIAKKYFLEIFQLF